MVAPSVAKPKAGWFKGSAMGFIADLVNRVAGAATGGGGNNAAPKYTYDQNTQTYTQMASGGMTASKRADGIAQRGKTRGTMIMCGGGYAKGKK